MSLGSVHVLERARHEAPRNLLNHVAFDLVVLEVELPQLDAPEGAAHGLLGQRALLRPDPLLAPETTAAVGVTARGTATHVEFGAQGEGAIEGVFTDYLVAGLDDHVGGGRYTRFSNCGGAAVEV